MKRVIIGINTDFSDSLYRVADAYVDCIIAAGGFPLIVPCHSGPEILEKYVEMADGFVFTGGSDYPPRYYGARRGPEVRLMNARRAKADLYLAQAVLARKLPVLGVCGGQQLINIALGGKLVQHLPNAADHQSVKQKNGRRKVIQHAIAITGGKILRRLFGRKKIIVNS
ncbi:MAG: gamma-glutamyl-gamma-aminobutyrate hydrolase family protein, partial [Kiritimatiellia bacterium]|nr:gamma-glutamyl-gamma-aminobutyrate hydrolase family protein [Kiritimatiellia bacterium]